MTEESAMRKFSEHFNPNDIRDFVEIEQGYVFFLYGATQPIFVNEHGTRGLNGNRKEDVPIINSASVAYEKGW